MTITRRRAKTIHELLFYALWGTLIACAAGFTADVPGVLQAALIVIAVSVFGLWLFMPPVPAQKARRRSPKRKAAPKRRSRKGWSF